MKEIKSVTTPQDVILQYEQRKAFAELLTKCLAMYVGRTRDAKPADAKVVIEFCRQAVKDSGSLLKGKVPDDVMERYRKNVAGIEQDREARRKHRRELIAQAKKNRRAA